MNEYLQEQINTWVEIFGCELKERCPQAFCMSAMTYVEFMQRELEEIEDKLDTNIHIEDICGWCLQPTQTVW